MDSSERHELVKRIFLRATELSGEERDAYVKDACGIDQSLCGEVEALLAHHNEKTIVEKAARPLSPPSQAAIGPQQRVGAGHTRASDRWSVFLFGDKRRQLLAVLVAAVVLAVLGYWTHARISDSLTTLRSEQLGAIRDANISALRVSIEDRKRDVTMWAGGPRVSAQINELVRLGQDSSTTVDQLSESEPRARLLALIDVYVKTEGIVEVGVVDRTGRVLSSLFDDIIGENVNGVAMKSLASVFAGQTEYAWPRLPGAWVAGAAREEFNRPVDLVAAPVRDANGNVVAALVLCMLGQESFSEILRVGRSGISGETYAFDRDGVMLSESRFDSQLVDIGLLEPGSHSTLTIEIRDPGGDLTKGYKPTLAVRARPLTKLAALAIAARESGAEMVKGEVLDPYRDYRGVEVVGAWEWIADYDLAVATEVDAAEAFAPLLYLDIAFGMLFGLLVVFVGISMYSSISVARLRRRVGETQRLGQYQLHGKIGEGGVGEVYLAQHEMLKRPTAVKILRAENISEETLARFEREVRLSSRLAHPNTIEIYDYGRSADGVFYYAMELLDGFTLQQLVKDGGALPVGRALHLLAQVCGSLREAHGLGLVHRDIKPMNIMACRRGGEFDVAKVLDFGLVKPVRTTTTLDITLPRQITGTPQYMAPERLSDPDIVDPRTDIYSWGAVAFFLLTAEKVHTGETDVEVFKNIMTATARRISDVRSDIDQRIDDLVASCLSRKPEDRPWEIDSLLSALEPLRNDYPWTDQDAEAWWSTHAARPSSLPA